MLSFCNFDSNRSDNISFRVIVVWMAGGNATAFVRETSAQFCGFGFVFVARIDWKNSAMKSFCHLLSGGPLTTTVPPSPGRQEVASLRVASGNTGFSNAQINNGGCTTEDGEFTLIHRKNPEI